MPFGVEADRPAIAERHCTPFAFGAIAQHRLLFGTVIDGGNFDPRQVGHVGFRLVGTAWILILQGTQRNRCSVISGGQLIRTSTIDVPAPGDV